MRILVYPKDGNPYQSLLYGAMKLQHAAVVRYCYVFPIIGVLPFLVYALWERVRGTKLAHIHWPAFRVLQPFPFHLQFSSWLFKASLWWLQLLGYKIVWTVHNVLPHEPQNTDDLTAARLMSQRSSAKIVHSSYTIQQMNEQGIDTTNMAVIPHGNYDGVYPEGVGRDAARQKFGIADDEFVILFFGNIRPYKGIEALLDAFDTAQLPRTRLIIAGNCTDDALRMQLEAAAQHPTIDFYNAYTPESEVEDFFTASDVVCLPFRAITTSGSVLLALGFGKPIIAPRMGALQDLPTNVGYLYDATNPQALAESLHAARTATDLAAKAIAARSYADSLSWDGIATSTYELYETVLAD